MKLSEILEESIRIGANTSTKSIIRRFKGKSDTAKKKRNAKAKRLSKGRSGFGQPPRQREIRGNRR